jgi:hypothetical protein
MTGREYVANVWQDDQPLPPAINARQRVCAGQLHYANDDRQRSLSVWHFPWYY